MTQKQCEIYNCPHNITGVGCTMYNTDRTDDARTVEFYEKWNPSRLAPKPTGVVKERDL